MTAYTPLFYHGDIGTKVYVILKGDADVFIKRKNVELSEGLLTEEEVNIF